ncbi:uncharacterized protein BDR25DRAFT_384060, partial [Lindgomyces ingoldianus]
KRHKVRKASVQKSYTKSVAHTQEAISTLFNDHESESAQAHKAQLTRLHELLTKKAEIEMKMQEKVSLVREAYLSHSIDLQMVAEQRVKQLS